MLTLPCWDMWRGNGEQHCRQGTKRVFTIHEDEQESKSMTARCPSRRPRRPAVKATSVSDFAHHSNKSLPSLTLRTARARSTVTCFKQRNTQHGNTSHTPLIPGTVIQRLGSYSNVASLSETGPASCFHPLLKLIRHCG